MQKVVQQREFLQPLTVYGVVTTDLSAKDCMVTFYESIHKQISFRSSGTFFKHTMTLYKTDRVSSTEEPQKGDGKNTA